MVGHKMVSTLNIPEISLQCLVRNEDKLGKLSSMIQRSKINVIDLNPLNFNILCDELDKFNPEYIINCSGVTIRKESQNTRDNLIFMNSLLPHLLNNWVSKKDKRLIHFSTDCVFNGLDDIYYDNSEPNETSLYGKSKSLGEINYSSNTLTLRGSMIGRELFDQTELLEWFLHQKNEITGYSNVFYSGITTERMSFYVKKIILQGININGLYNVSSVPITKYHLLKIFNKVYNKRLKIKKETSKKSKKILKSENFYTLLEESIPNWNTDLIKDLTKEINIYE